MLLAPLEACGSKKSSAPCGAHDDPFRHDPWHPGKVVGDLQLLVPAPHGALGLERPLQAPMRLGLRGAGPRPEPKATGVELPGMR